MPTPNSFPPAPSELDAELPRGTVLSERYRIDALLGEGGMGKVYAGEHILLRKKIAIKVLRGHRALVPEVVARFEREAMAAANIGHPNIAEANDFGRLPDGGVFLVLEYVQGRNLRDVIAQGPLSVQESLHIARQVASALAAAQELGIVHRDLKPENVMLIQKAGDTSFVKVLDFGIARVPMAEGSAQPLTKAGAVFGTPDYMAPEQAFGQKVDGRADLYSLGVMLFEMLAGVRPYAGGGVLAGQLAAPIPKIEQRAPSVAVPPAVEALVQRLLAQTPGARPTNAAEVLQAIDALLPAQTRPRAGAPPPPRRATPSSAAPSSAAPPRPSAPSSAAPSSAAPSSAAPSSAARLETFMPGDPLPAFELTGVELPRVSGPAEPLDAPTLLRAPRVDERPSAEPPPASGAPIAPATATAPSVRATRDGAANPFSRFAAAVGHRTIALYQRACIFIDAHRDTLPNPIRRRLRRVPAKVLVALLLGAALLALLSVLALIGAARSRGDEAPARAEPQAATPRAPLAPAPPSSPVDLPTRARTELDARRDDAAVALVAEALAAKPELRDDRRVGDLLARAARSKSESAANASLDLLTSRMGQTGAEVVYDLSLDASAVEGVRARALGWLKTKDFDRASSPALYSAVRLRLAGTCEQKRAMLKLAENVGGRQTLDYLRELERCKPGASEPCYPCLHDGSLKRTMAAIEKRLEAPSSP